MSSPPKPKSVAAKPTHPPFDKMIVAAFEFLNAGQTDDKARKTKTWSYQRIVQVVCKQNKLEDTSTTRNSIKRGWKKSMNAETIVRPKKYEDMGDKARGFAKLGEVKSDKPVIKPKAKKPVVAKTAPKKKTTKKTPTKKAAPKKAGKSPGKKSTAKKATTKTKAAAKKGPKARTPNKKIGKKPAVKKTTAKKSPKSPKK